MKLFFERKKLNKIGRASLCIMLALASICAVPSVAFAGTADVGYKWSRIHTYSELTNAFGPTSNSSLTSDNFWSRILILDHSGNYYMGYREHTDKSEEYSLTRIGATTGIVAGAESFITRSDLGVPFIKFKNTNRNYNGFLDSNDYYIRYASDPAGGVATTLTNYCLAINLKWYGIAWHAAAYSMFVTAPINDPSSAEDESGACCSASVRTEWTIEMGKTTYVKGHYLTEAQMNALGTVCSYYYGSSDDETWVADSEYGTYKKDYGAVNNFSKALALAKSDGHKGFYKKIYTQYGSYWSAKNNYTLDAKNYDYSIFDEPVTTATGAAAVKEAESKLVIREADLQAIKDDIEVYKSASSWIDRDFASIYFYEDQTFRAWNTKNGKIELSKNATGSKTTYMLYSGVPQAISIIMENTVLNTYSSYRLDNYVIDNSTQLTIPEGSTLVLSGTCYNNGRIVVDGGVLVIQEYLDSDPKQDNGIFTDSTGDERYAPGDILIKNGGTLIVENTGVLIHRNGAAGLILTSGGTARIEGVLLVANLFSLSNGASLRATPGSLITVGVMPKETGKSAEYTAANIKKNKSGYLAGIVDKNSDKNSTANSQLNRTGGLYIGAGCSFDSQGGIFKEPSYTISVDSKGYYGGKTSTNINANLESMMRYWSNNF